jgi:hypothetical protein
VHSRVGAIINACPFVMVLLVALFLVIIVSYAFLTFDEELLVILSTLFWFDSAGSLIKKMLEVELIEKVDNIRSRFVWFLVLKQQLLTDLLKLHKSRGSLYSSLVLVNSVFIVTLVNHVVSLFVNVLFLRRKFLADNLVDSFGNGVYYDYLSIELADIYVLGKFSNVIVDSEDLRNTTVVSFNTYLSPVFA